MVSTRPLIPKYSSPCTNTLVTVTSAPITISITFTFMFHSFYQFSHEVLIFISLFAFLQFYSVVSRNGKVYYSAGSLFFCCWLTLGLVVWPRLGDPFVSQNLIESCEVEWYSHVPYHNDSIIVKTDARRKIDAWRKDAGMKDAGRKTQEGRLLYKYFTSHFICKVCVWEDAGDWT